MLGLPLPGCILWRGSLKQIDPRSSLPCFMRGKLLHPCRMTLRIPQCAYCLPRRDTPVKFRFLRCRALVRLDRSEHSMGPAADGSRPNKCQRQRGISQAARRGIKAADLAGRGRTLRCRQVLYRAAAQPQCGAALPRRTIRVQSLRRRMFHAGTRARTPLQGCHEPVKTLWRADGALLQQGRH